MLIVILSLLFVAVFVFLSWRIIARAKFNADDNPKFVCPHCNEVDCICHQKRS